MKKVVKERIDKYLSRCGENGDEFISVVTVDRNSIAKCGWCGIILADVRLSYRPNFCPECGVLLDWAQEDEE